MRIDAHQHFWKYDSFRHGWIDDSMVTIRRDFLPKDLLGVLKKNDMDGCVAVQADQSEAETEFLLDCAENNDFIKGVVGWVNLCSPNVSERLEDFSKNTYFKGVRHILQSEDENFIRRKDFQNGISKLGALDLTYDLLIFPKQLRHAAALVQKFPDQRFILDHLAKPNIKREELKEWQSDIIELAKNKNVFCKLSGLVTEADWKNWNSEDFRPYIETVLEVFGTSRSVFGSDWPVCLLAGDYEDVIGIIEGYTEHLSSGEKQRVMGANAINFYNLKD